MKLIALGSNGPQAGKTTLAKELGDLGFQVVNYSTYLVRLFVEYINKQRPDFLTVEEIYDHKEDWRPTLQKFSEDIGFNSGLPFIPMSLNDLDHNLPVVFDSVRTVTQAVILREYGFAVVSLYIPDYVRRERAGSDADMARLETSMKHPTEQELPRTYIDLRVSGTQNPYALALHLASNDLTDLQGLRFPDR